MNPASTSFVLGYHGCDRAVADRVMSGKASLKPSQNDYDWLGDGIYFWEHNGQRAFDFAREVARTPRNKRQQIANPSVVGAIIDLGLCLNLLDGRFIDAARGAYVELVRSSRAAGLPLPTNTVGFSETWTVRLSEWCITHDVLAVSPRSTPSAPLLSKVSASILMRDSLRRTTSKSAFEISDALKGISVH